MNSPLLPVGSPLSLEQMGPNSGSFYQAVGLLRSLLLAKGEVPPAETVRQTVGDVINLLRCCMSYDVTGGAHGATVRAAPAPQTVLTDGEIRRIANYLQPDSVAFARAIEAKVLQHVSGVLGTYTDQQKGGA